MEQEPMPTEYQVFLNHRGPDSKNNLVSLIHGKLKHDHRLSVFLDEKEIRTGDRNINAIEAAIQSASVHITIFSENYAQSEWCLNELCMILKSVRNSNKKIIPVFLDVEPFHLRHIEKGAYKDAFKQHKRKGRVSTAQIEEWKEALKEASFLSGKLVNSKKSNLWETMKEIVNIVLEELFIKQKSLVIPKYPVGLYQARQDLKEILEQNKLGKTKIIGIGGMSGSGKSTLAKYVYNSCLQYFLKGRSCFLFDVGKKDVSSLQSELFHGVFGYNEALQHMGNTEEGKRIIQSFRLLLVFDGVDNIDQINDLLDIDSVGRGSLIIITSTDRDLLRRTSRNTFLYNVKPLNRAHARELFCAHAFPQSKPPEELKALVEEFLEICKDLPLSLKVLGGHFVGRAHQKEYWERKLILFRLVLHEDIMKTFRVIYNALNDREKEAFLDVGCFLVGGKTESAIRVLNELHGSDIVHSLESLHQKCLIDFHYDLESNYGFECRQQEDNPNIGYDDISVQYRGYNLTMHSQLEKLARNIAREQFSGLSKPLSSLRLSCFDDFVELRKWKGESDKIPIRGIRISKENTPDFKLENITADRVRLLALETRAPLHFGSWQITGDLVWLRLRNFQFDSMHSLSSISVKSLTVLELEGDANSIENVFQKLMQQLLKNPDTDKVPLRVTEISVKIVDDPQAPSTSSSGSTFDVGHSIGKSENPTSSDIQQGVVPVFFSNFLKWAILENLEKMVVTNLRSPPSLPFDFGELPILTHLDLSGCTNLKELPKSFAKLTRLQHLALRDCKNLLIPFDVLGEILTLEYADFEGCEQLEYLPQGIPYQSHLRYLNLLGTSLSQLPEDLELLGNLEQLRIGSPKLRMVPLSVAKLRSLKELIVIQCSGLECLLPERILAPKTKILRIDSCPIASFSFEKDERTMDVLRDLTLTKTAILEICMGEGVYRWLQTIDLSENIMLKQVTALPSASLVRVNLQNCCKLKTIKNLSYLVNLKFLNINGCCELETLGVEGLISLEEIEAGKCWKLKKIEGLSSLKRLKCFRISTDISEDLDKIWESDKFVLQKVDNLVSLRDAYDFAEMRSLRDDYDREPEMLYDMEAGMLYDMEAGVLYDREAGMLFDGRGKEGCSAILLCFMNINVRRRHIFSNASLSVNFSNDKSTIHVGAEGEEARLYVFMWTQYSRLFQDLGPYSRIAVEVSARERNCVTGWFATKHKVDSLDEHIGYSSDEHIDRVHKCCLIA